MVTPGDRSARADGRAHNSPRATAPASVEIVALLVSPLHRYAGRPRDGATPLPAHARPERRSEVEVVAGHGIVGDRYYGHAAHRTAAVTLIDADALDEVAGELGIPPFDADLTRRNVVLRGLSRPGIELDALRAATVSLDCGAGVILLGAGRPARPCSWMDTVIAPGARVALRGRGGIRCEPLSSGVLRLGSAQIEVQPTHRASHLAAEAGGWADVRANDPHHADR